MASLTNTTDSRFAMLNEICLIKSGVLSSKKVSINVHGHIPFIKAKDIQFGSIYNSHDKLSKEIVKKLGIEITPKDSILISVTGQTAGSIALLETDAIVENSVYYSITNVEIIRPEYLCYYLHYKRSQIIRTSKCIDRVSILLLNKLKIPLPPIGVQKDRIAELEKQIKYAELRQNKVQVELTSLRNQREKILQTAFSFFGRENKQFLKHGEIVRIKNCGRVKAGKTPTGSVRQYFGTEFPFFVPGSLEQGMNMLNTNTYLSPRGIIEARSFTANSILVCYNGAKFGKAGIARTTGACNSQMISITPYETVVPEYLYFQIIAPHFQLQMLTKAKNFAISKFQFEDLSIVLPSLEKQKEIVAALTISLSALHFREAKLTLQLQEADTMKRGAYTQAFG